PMSAAGLLLGFGGCLVAMFRGGHGIGYPVAGAVVSTVALAIGIFWAAFPVALIEASRVAKENEKKMAEKEAKEPAAPPTGKKDEGTKRGQPKGEDGDWVDVRKAVRQGDVTVRIQSVSVGFVDLENLGKPTRSAKQHLILR